MDTPRSQTLSITPGFHETEHTAVAHLFWQAFQGKLSLLLRPEAKTLQFITSALNPDFAIAARDADGTLLGVAGFKTSEGALVGGGCAIWPGFMAV